LPFSSIELELGARIVAGAVFPRELLGEPGAEPGPEDGHHDVGIGRFGDLGLEGVGGEERFVFPEYRLQDRPPGKLALQSIHHPLGKRTFLVHVPRRGDEEGQFADFGHRSAGTRGSAFHPWRPPAPIIR